MTITTRILQAGDEERLEAFLLDNLRAAGLEGNGRPLQDTYVAGGTGRKL